MNPKPSASHDNSLLRNWHIALPEYTTWVMKHAAEIYLVNLLIRNCAFSWYNKRRTLT